VYKTVSIEPADGLSAAAAYEHAYETYWHDVFRFALAWTNDWAAAEDLTQEAYMRLWKGRTTVDWNREALPWLLLVTRRLATDRFRAIRRRLQPPPAPNNLDEAARARWMDVQTAMRALSPLERTALVLTAVQGYPSADVAAILTTSPGAVRAAVSRAREKLDGAR
jgi:RNA polymerase sigma-70 factor (ECF subfamily)